MYSRGDRSREKFNSEVSSLCMHAPFYSVSCADAGSTVPNPHSRLPEPRHCHTPRVLMLLPAVPNPKIHQIT